MSVSLYCLLNVCNNVSVLSNRALKKTKIPENLTNYGVNTKHKFVKKNKNKNKNKKKGSHSTFYNSLKDIGLAAK